MLASLLRPGPTDALADTYLQAKAADLVQPWQGALPNADLLHQLATTHGLDLATAAFFQSVLSSPLHGEFFRQVNEQPLGPALAQTRLNLLIVPALFYREKPQFGGDGLALAELARERGHRVAVAPLYSRGSMATNAELVWRCVEQSTATPLWLVSLSKGGGEVRLALQTHPSDELWRKVEGWLNISGLVRGTPLAQQYQLALQTYFRLAGVDPQTAHELSSHHPDWLTEWRPPAHWWVVNVLGTPLSRHIEQRNLRWRYARLARHGPNDGMALLPDLIVEPGLVYPLWGADHFLQAPWVKLHFTRLLAYLEQHRSLGLPRP